MRLCIAFLFFFTSMAFANPTCTGKASGLSISANGNVLGTIRNGSNVNLSDVVFCSVNSVDTGFSSETCKTTFSLLMFAEAQGKNVTMWFHENQFDSCTQSWKDLKSIGFYHLRVN